MRKNYFFLLIVAIIVMGGMLLFASAARKVSQRDLSRGKIQIVASFYPVSFFAQKIGGDKVLVRTITPAGVEPHDYDPTAQDIAQIERSDLFVLNGELEAWGDDIQQNLQNTKVRVVIAGKGLFTRAMKEEGKAVNDPHVWLDPFLAQEEASAIADALVRIDTPNASYYRANEQELFTKLDTLNADYQTGLRLCQQYDFITSHAAFGYLALRYGLRQVSVAGPSPDEEPSARQVADIVDFARSKNITYIFSESLVSPKLSETIATEVGAKTLVLDPLEGLADARIQAGEDYFSVMRDNLKNLRLALQCL